VWEGKASGPVSDGLPLTVDEWWSFVIGPASDGLPLTVDEWWSFVARCVLYISMAAVP